MVARRLGEVGRNVDFAYEMVFAALIGGLVGAKLWYVAENGGAFFSGTGLVFYGGAIGGARPGAPRGGHRGGGAPPPPRTLAAPRGAAPASAPPRAPRAP